MSEDGSRRTEDSLKRIGERPLGQRALPFRRKNRERVAGFFGDFLWFDFEAGGFEQQGILYDLAGFLREIGREFKVGQNGLPESVAPASALSVL